MQDSINAEEQQALLGGAQAKASHFDFRDPPKHNKMQLRSLRVLHENFCEPLSRTIGALTNMPCKATLAGLSAEKAVLQPARAHICAASSRSKFLIGLGRAAAWLMLERLMGGKGLPGPVPERPYSELEQRVLLNMSLTPVLKHYNELWARVTPVEFKLENFAPEGPVAWLPPASETITAVFKLIIGGTESEIAFILPLPFLKPLMPELDISKLLRGEEEEGPQTGASDNSLLSVPVNLCVLLGKIDVRLKDLNSLAVGDVLRLDCRQGDEVRVDVEGQPRFSAKVGRLGGSLGVQILRSLEQTTKTKDGGRNAGK